MTCLTIPEVAERLRITRQWAYVLVRRGEIPSFRLGRIIRVDPDRLQDWIDKGGTPEAQDEEVMEVTAEGGG